MAKSTQIQPSRHLVSLATLVTIELLLPSVERLFEGVMLVEEVAAYKVRTSRNVTV